MLDTFLKYDSDKYMINMDFTNIFYRNIFYDIGGKYEIDLTNPETPKWTIPDNSRYKIDKVFGWLSSSNIINITF